MAQRRQYCIWIEEESVWSCFAEWNTMRMHMQKNKEIL